MQKKKVPTGLVLALAVLVVIGVFVNGGDALRTAGFNLGKAPEKMTELKGQQLSEAEMQQQKDAMKTARATRQQGADMEAATGIPDKPALLIEPDLGNFKQSFNESTTAAQWYRDDSYIEKKKRETEAVRGD